MSREAELSRQNVTSKMDKKGQNQHVRMAEKKEPVQHEAGVEGQMLNDEM